MDFEKNWKNHRQALLNFIKTKVDGAVAEDILQEIGLKFYQNLEKNKEIRNARTWLFQVARNTIADYYRKSEKKPTQVDHERPNSFQAIPCVCDLSGFVIQNYLPEKYAQPLYWSDIEQQPQKKIAERLNLSLTATKSRIQRARQKLRTLIEGCVEIVYNEKNEVVDYNLKDSCELPPELLEEIKKLNLVL